MKIMLSTVETRTYEIEVPNEYLKPENKKILLEDLAEAWNNPETRIKEEWVDYCTLESITVIDGLTAVELTNDDKRYFYEILT